MRTPLPHISASLPSGLKMRSAKRASPVCSPMSRMPSEPMPEVAVAEQAHARRRELEGELVHVEDDVVVAEALPLRELDLAETLPLRLHGIMTPCERRARGSRRAGTGILPRGLAQPGRMSPATAAAGRPATGTSAASGSLRIQVSWRRARPRVRAFMRAAASGSASSPSRTAQSSRTPIACAAVRENGPAARAAATSSSAPAASISSTRRSMRSLSAARSSSGTSANSRCA